MKANLTDIGEVTPRQSESGNLEYDHVAIFIATSDSVVLSHSCPFSDSIRHNGCQKKMFEKWPTAFPDLLVVKHTIVVHNKTSWGLGGASLTFWFAATRQIFLKNRHKHAG